MARLSRVSSGKRKRQDAAKSKLMSRMASRSIIKKEEDEMLLGNLFISVNDTGEIEDLNKNYNINACRVNISKAAQIKYNTGSIEFNGVDSNLNVKDNDKVAVGIEDFSLDWWECARPLPKPNYDFMPALQCVMYKNSIDRKKPLIIQNDDINKYIFLSSDGDHWDIADMKYMGEATKDEWVHWALIRCNNNFYTFRNGEVKNIWKSSEIINPSEEYFTIGSGPKGGYFYGHMNKIRFTKGQALWTEEFDVQEDLFY
jgi:hypothetical protein